MISCSFTLQCGFDTHVSAKATHGQNGPTTNTPAFKWLLAHHATHTSLPTPRSTPCSRGHEGGSPSHHRGSHVKSQVNAFEIHVKSTLFQGVLFLCHAPDTTRVVVSSQASDLARCVRRSCIGPVRVDTIHFVIFPLVILGAYLAPGHNAMQAWSHPVTQNSFALRNLYM
jgi:hypothetical protein